MRPFLIERYFAKYEFTADHMLSASDCEALSLDALLKMADPGMLRLWESLRLSYTESRGHPLLLEEICKRYETISTEDVLVAVPEECIYIAMQMILRKSDRVICLRPAYQSLYEIAQSSGCKVQAWELTAKSGRWHLDLDFLRANITARTRLIIINFPHNPTGYLPNRAELDELVRIATAHDAFIFSDEMYRGLEMNPADRLPSLCDIYDKAITLSGLSKSLSLPGLRIGWLATRFKPLMENFLRFKDYTTICNSAPSEILGIIGLRAAASIVAGNQILIRNNIKLAASTFARFPQLIEWLPPAGGSVAFPKWLGSRPIDELAEELVQQRSVLMLAGSIFEMTEPHFRIGLGRADFPQALEQFAAYLEAGSFEH